jgi:hypothetical protein
MIPDYYFRERQRRYFLLANLLSKDSIGEAIKICEIDYAELGAITKTK